MAPIKKLGASEEYHQVNKVGRTEFTEKSDCAVIAFSLVTGMSYADSHALLKKSGRKDRKGTFMDTTCQALKEAGFVYRYWGSAKKVQMVNSYPGIHGKVLKGITTHHPARFPDQWGPELKGKTFLFKTRNHILAVIDGKAHDWSSDRALRVIDVIEVVKAPKREA